MDYWDLMQFWDKVIPPSRPSSEQIEYLIEFAKNINKGDPVAVLGSTVEFRDTLFELGFDQIYVFDQNESFFERSFKEKIYNNPEIFIHGNWLETIEKYPDKFSLIVSDLTSGNIEYKDRTKFYLDIENALRAGGHFYDKVLTHHDFIPIDALIEKYKHLPINNCSVNYFNCEFLFCSDLLEKEGIVKSTVFYDTISNLTSNLRIQKFVEKSKFITPENFQWYYGKLWNELKCEYCINLQLITCNDDFLLSPYYKRVKIFHLKKNADEKH
jgi:hypothetical protein